MLRKNHCVSEVVNIVEDIYSATMVGYESVWWTGRGSFSCLKHTRHIMTHSEILMRGTTVPTAVQETCATVGEGLHEGLDWLAQAIADKGWEVLKHMLCIWLHVQKDPVSPIEESAVWLIALKILKKHELSWNLCPSSRHGITSQCWFGVSWANANARNVPEIPLLIFFSYTKKQKNQRYGKSFKLLNRCHKNDQQAPVVLMWYPQIFLARAQKNGPHRKSPMRFSCAKKGDDLVMWIAAQLEPQAEELAIWIHFKVTVVWSILTIWSTWLFPDLFYLKREIGYWIYLKAQRIGSAKLWDCSLFCFSLRCGGDIEQVPQTMTFLACRCL